jgi:hypothetical protein
MKMKLITIITASIILIQMDVLAQTPINSNQTFLVADGSRW